MLLADEFALLCCRSIAVNENISKLGFSSFTRAKGQLESSLFQETLFNVVWITHIKEICKMQKMYFAKEVFVRRKGEKKAVDECFLCKDFLTILDSKNEIGQRKVLQSRKFTKSLAFFKLE